MITVDCRWIGKSGVGRHLENGLSALSGKYPLHLLCHKEDRKRLELYSDSLIFLKSPCFTFQEQVELPLKIPRCTLFWSPHFNLPFLPIRAKKRVVTIHDLFHLSPYCSSRFKRWSAKRFLKKGCQADLVLVVSEFTKRELLSHFSLNIRCLKNIGNATSFRPQILEGIREKYHLPDRYFLVVGNGKPHKNLARLIEAYERQKCEEDLVIVGNPALSFSNKKIHSLGFVMDDDLPSLYTLASALCFPSLYEGFGLPPLEALSCGCQVIAAKIAPVIEVCGDRALYFDPLDVESIGKALKKKREGTVSSLPEQVGMIKWRQEFLEAIDACCHHP